MAKGPGLFSDIGKNAKDLLKKDYTADQKLTLSTFSDIGVGLTSTTTKKGESSTGDLSAVYKYNDTTIEVKVDSGSNVELQYLHDNAAVTTAVGLNQSPVLDFTLTLGTPALAQGLSLNIMLALV